MSTSNWTQRPKGHVIGQSFELFTWSSALGIQKYPMSIQTITLTDSCKPHWQLGNFRPMKLLIKIKYAWWWLCQSPTWSLNFFKWKWNYLIKSSLSVSLNTTLSTINRQINPPVFVPCRMDKTTHYLSLKRNGKK